VTCGKCTEAKASIPSLGFNDPVKVCRDCMAQLGAATAGAPAS
jgi:hypothetical protein